MLRLALPIAYFGGLTFTFAVWLGLVTGGVSATAIAGFAGLCLLFVATGRIVLDSVGLGGGDRGGITLALVLGYLMVSLALYALVLLRPLSVGAGAAALAILAFVVLLFLRRRGALDPAPVLAVSTADLAALAVCVVGATLWARDGFTPLIVEGESAIFRTWVDRFLHTRFISIFAQTEYLQPLPDPQMAGAPLAVYHYATYLVPAMVKQLSGATAYQVFAGFYIPFGLLIAGLAAFCFAKALFGAWPGVLAAAAIVLLPDAYQQGFGSRYLGYNWVQQAHPGGFYGVACYAVAWVFILLGCQNGRYSQVALGYAAAVLGVFFKAHLFVANAFLVMLYPCFFFKRLSRSFRAVIGVGFVALFVLVVHLSQRFESVPVIRLDGSSAGAYLAMHVPLYDRGALKSLLTELFLVRDLPNFLEVALAVAAISISTFGLWLVALAATVWAIRGRIDDVTWWFPSLIYANYIVMSLGLAMDTRRVGMPDELLHRPLVWAYFAIVAWTAGAATRLYLGEDRSPSLRELGVGGLALLVAVWFPWSLAWNLQTAPTLGHVSFRKFAAFPSCLVQAANHIRESSTPREVVQSSGNDPHLLVTGISERQAYAVDYSLGVRRPSGIAERLAELADFKRMTNERDIENFLSSRGIGWYVLEPDAGVAWPRSFLERPVFECGGYRVYRSSH